MHSEPIEELPPEVLAEVARMQAKQAEERQQKSDFLNRTTRNQRRVNKKLQSQQIKKHMRNLK